MDTLFLILQIIGLIIIFAELIYVLLQKPSVYQSILIVLILSCALMFVGYAIEVGAYPPSGMSEEAAKQVALTNSLMGAKIGYLGKPFSLLATLFLFMEYSRIKPKKIVVVSLIILFSFFTIMVFTNDYHYLFYSSVDYNQENIGSKLVLGHGILWYIYMALMFVLFILYTIIAVFEYKHSHTKQSKHITMYFFLMLGSSILGLLLFVLKLTAGYDTTLTGTLVSAVLLFILFSKYHMFEYLAASKDKALDEFKDAFILVDARMNITYFNQVALKLVPELKDLISKRNDKQIIEALDMISENGNMFALDKVFNVTCQELHSAHSQIFIGKIYNLKDITDSYKYSERLESDVLSKTKEIKNMQRAVIGGFANLIEARDSCTGTHIKNTSKYAGMIALSLRELGIYKDIITDQYIQILIDVAPLHDVGKIYISDNILNKPGKLSIDEYEEMKKHTILGERIVEDIIQDIEDPEYVRMAKEIALYHHERWDGKGYPNQLKGEEIPLSARIMAISDVYDALRSARPYKIAFTRKDSVRIILEESGTHFDPKVIKAFEEISEIIESRPEELKKYL